MPIIFYDHLINRQEIIILIDNSQAPDNQKGKLKQLIDDIIHQGITEFLLSKLNPKHHKTFLSQLHHAPYDPELIDLLKEKIADDIEDQIHQYANSLIKKLKKDLDLKEN